MHHLRPILMTFPMAVGAISTGLAEDAKLQTIHLQPSHVIATNQVELAVTQVGGHMAPVTFFRDTAKPVAPYHISPWQDDPAAEMPAPVSKSLRGDFFCIPFGGNSDEVAGEKHPPHGEVAGSLWTFASQKIAGDVTTLTLNFETKVRKGGVTKELSLVDGQNVVYSKISSRASPEKLRPGITPPWQCLTPKAPSGSRPAPSSSA